MTKFKEWRRKYLGDVSSGFLVDQFDLENAYEAGYKQRDEEINEHYRKVMNNEESTENTNNSIGVGDRDYSC